MKKIAVFDIGTNSIKFLLSCVEKGKMTTILDMNNISGLGAGLYKNGVISQSAMTGNIKILENFLTIAEKEEAEIIMAAGTMCLRTARNGNIFQKKAKDKLGLNIEIISGNEEARLSYLAAASSLDIDEKKVMVFDIGGGSTEIIFGNGRKIRDSISLAIGAVQLTEKFLFSDPVTDLELQEMLTYLKKKFRKELSAHSCDLLVGIGGTVTTIGAVKKKMTVYEPEKIHGSVLTMKEVKKQLELYKIKTISERKKIAGLEPERADIILTGTAIVYTLLNILKFDSLTISDRGLRHGLLLDRFSENDF